MTLSRVIDTGTLLVAHHHSPVVESTPVDLSTPNEEPVGPVASHRRVRPLRVDSDESVLAKFAGFRRWCMSSRTGLDMELLFEGNERVHQLTDITKLAPAPWLKIWTTTVVG